MTTPRPFNAADEGQKLFALSREADPTAFQREMNDLKTNPAHYAATMRAVQAQEKMRETMAQQSMSPGSKLHELKIVPDGKGGVKEIDTKEVPVEQIGKEDSLPGLSIWKPGAAAASEATKEAGKPAETAQTAAQREAAQRAAAERLAQQLTEEESKKLLASLQNHDRSGFAKEYDSLSEADKKAVSKAMQLDNHDPSLRITLNTDQTIGSITQNGKLDYIAPGDFLNQTYDKKNDAALADYYSSLSPEDKAKFAKALQDEAPKHDETVILDSEGNLKQINGANGKKVYPDGGIGKFLRKEGAQIQVRRY